jgi:ribonuclease P protein component
VSEPQAGTAYRDPRTGSQLPRHARLTTAAAFGRVFKQPTISTDRCFKVLARTSEGDRPRLGMAVSRKVNKRAAGRNRIKRVIRESFRKYFAGDARAVDFVVLPGSESATICNRQLFRSLEHHWAQVMATIDGAPKQAQSPRHKGAA